MISEGKVITYLPNCEDAGLRGHVFAASDGTPIAGASVQVGNYYSAATDAGGAYTIEGVPMGTYSLTVSVGGSTVLSGTVTVSSFSALSTNDFALANVAAPPEPFTYTTNNGAITIAGYTGAGGAVSIPSVIYGLPVVAIGDHAFQGTSVTSVTIPEGVTNIGNYAFQGCAGLASVFDSRQRHQPGGPGLRLLPRPDGGPVPRQSAQRGFGRFFGRHWDRLLPARDHGLGRGVWRPGDGDGARRRGQHASGERKRPAGR